MKMIWLGLIACLLSAQTVRVGTFHKASVAVAYYRSPLWAETMKSQMAAMQAAKRAHDTQKAKELEDWGGKHQELAHQQLTGEAPITNILEALAPAFPEIAQRAHVAMVVADLPYADASVQTVDVTDFILDWLKADEATRKIVQELRKKP
jgi:hypothetical protein